MKTLYTASCKWRGPADSEKVIYYAGITQDKFTNLKLVDSYDSAYPSKTAFKFIVQHPLTQLFYLVLIVQYHMV